jgi:hypothetical protein
MIGNELRNVTGPTGQIHVRYLNEFEFPYKSR